MNELSKKVVTLAFVLKDTQLYLDTHPHDEAALGFYDKYRNLFEKAAAEYEQQYGPLTPAGVNIKDGWTWATMPWPWETGE